MTFRLQTKESGSFLVKFEDGKYFICPRSKILTEGRVKVNEHYNVIWGTKDEQDIAEVIDKGLWIDMRKKQIEIESKENSSESPNHGVNATSSEESSPAAVSPLSGPPTPQIKKRKRESRKMQSKKMKPEASLIKLTDGTNSEQDDPFLFRSPVSSPELPYHLEGPSPLESPVSVTHNINVENEIEQLPAFSIERSFIEMRKLLEVQCARSAELERLVIQQQETIANLSECVNNLSEYVKTEMPLIKKQVIKLGTCNEQMAIVGPQIHAHASPTENVQTPARNLETPKIFRPFEDAPVLSPSLNSYVNTPTGRHPRGLIAQSLFSNRSDACIPMHLFQDIPDSFRLSKKDLEVAIYANDQPGNFGVSILRLLFPELFTADRLRQHYSYNGGKKNPLNITKKFYLRRYVVAFFPEVKEERAYQERVVSKINGALRRKVANTKQATEN